MKKRILQTLAKCLACLLGAVLILWVGYQMSPGGRSMVVTWVGKWGPGAVPLIRHAIHDEDVKVREAAIRALVAMGEEAVPSLTETLGDRSATNRMEAVYALAVLGPKAKGALPALLELLKDPDPEMRQKPQQALWSMRPHATQPHP